MSGDANEFKVVHREETFTDLAVQELAQTKAACLCRLEFGRCKLEHCDKCTVRQELEECETQMSGYNRARLAKYTAAYYVTFADNPEAWLNPKRFLLYNFGFIALGYLAIVTISALLALFLNGGAF